MMRSLFIAMMLTTVVVGCDGILVVNGRVVDELGAPVIGARVNVSSSAPNAPRTDKRGCFHFFRITGWSKHEVPFLVEAGGHLTYLGTVTSPEVQQVIVHLPHLGGDPFPSLEKVAADPSCPEPHQGAGQLGVDPDGPSARWAADREEGL